ncbi:hypothetical protein OIO90_002103 [Microbotryomycetes sp. JL221]|nr:hypothetical protein OIO90_002103 [Microbotryomycetes sp. JL221]
MSQMKAILVKNGKSDSAKDLYIGDTDKPTPKQGEVLVQVRAFGLNRMDILQRRGLYPLPAGITKILGVEFSGIVAESNSSKFNNGDHVFGLAYGGAYSQYIAVADGMVTKKPSEVSWVEAASIPENWLTAYQALFLIADMQQGHNVLIHAGASGVGLAAIQLAKTFGAAKIFATAGTSDKCKFVEQHGAAKCINYKEQDFASEILKQTENAGVNVIVDFVGANYWDNNIKVMARDGRMVLLGTLSGGKTSAPTDISPILFKRLRIEGSTLRSRSLEYQSNLLQQFSEKALDKLFSRCGDGKGHGGLDLVIHKVYNWKDISEAHEEMEGARNVGKMICVVEDE